MNLVALVMVFLSSAAGEEPAVERARQMLARQLNLAAETIEVREVARADWRGPGLRCEVVRDGDPVVEGYRVVLAASPNVYVLHVREDAAVVCGLNPASAGDALPDSANPRHRKLVDHARRDLAGRLRIGASEIQLVDVVDVTWSDASLGCPQPDRDYPQVLTAGTRIRFRIGSRVYQYHVGPGGTPVPCDRPEAVEPLPDR